MPAAMASAVRASMPLPYLIVPGQVNDLACPLELGAQVVEPESARLTLYDGNTVVLDSVVADVSAPPAVYRYDAPSTLTLSEGWRARWKVVFAGSEPEARRTHWFENRAFVVRYRPHCPLGIDDLFRAQPSLDPGQAEPLSGMTAEQIDDLGSEAWLNVQMRLIEQGRRPWRRIGGADLREVVMETWLAKVFDALSKTQPRYRETADVHLAAARDAWGRVRLDYDDEQDGVADAVKPAAESPVFYVGGLR